MIQPSPCPNTGHEVHHQRHHPPARVLYELVASGDLPCFDPLFTIKQCLLSPYQTQVFNRVIHATRYVLFPMYLAGFLLRFAVIFSPVDTGRLFGPVTLGLQFWMVFQVIFAFRVEFAKVLVGTFEFWFMLVNSTAWMICFGLYLQDPRALLIPSCWVDFADMLLIETYFQNTLNVAIVASASACFLLSLSIGVSLNAIEGGQHIAIAQVSFHVLSTKDILVNTMATMITLLVRLSYRKYETLRNQKRKTTDSVSYTQSSGYRCRIALRSTSAIQAFIDPACHTSLSSTSSTSPTAAATAGYENTEGYKKLLHMQFVRVTALFDSERTISPRVNGLVANLQTWQRGLLYCFGLVGFVVTPVLLLSSISSSESVHLVSLCGVVGLCATLVFWLPFLCCAQRQLVLKLWTSFDFLFVFAQLMTAHVALCDMLSWEWVNCCGVLSSFLWMLGVLTIDTITPVMRSHLGWRSWLVVPMVASFMLQQAVLSWETLQGTDDLEHFQNRRLFNSQVGSYQVEFYTMPFFLSRQFTLFVWCIRILHRFRTRKSNQELLMMLGNVEYDYQSWKRENLRTKQQAKPRVRAKSVLQRIAGSLQYGLAQIVPEGIET